MRPAVVSRRRARPRGLALPFVLCLIGVFLVFLLAGQALLDELRHRASHLHDQEQARLMADSGLEYARSVQGRDAWRKAGRFVSPSLDGGWFVLERSAEGGVRSTGCCGRARVVRRLP